MPTVSQRGQPGQLITEIPPPPLFLSGRGVGRVRSELLDFQVTEEKRTLVTVQSPAMLDVSEFNHL